MRVERNGITFLISLIKKHRINLEVVVDRFKIRLCFLFIESNLFKVDYDKYTNLSNMKSFGNVVLSFAFDFGVIKESF